MRGTPLRACAYAYTYRHTRVRGRTSAHLMHCVNCAAQMQTLYPANEDSGAQSMTAGLQITFVHYVPNLVLQANSIAHVHTHTHHVQ